MSHSQEFLSCKCSVPVPWNNNNILMAGSLTLGVCGQNGIYCSHCCFFKSSYILFSCLTDYWVDISFSHSLWCSLLKNKIFPLFFPTFSGFIIKCRSDWREKSLGLVSLAQWRWQCQPRLRSLVPPGCAIRDNPNPAGLRKEILLRV